MTPRDSQHTRRRPLRRSVGRVAVAGYRALRRVWAKVFSLGISGSFADFGSGTVIQPPLRLVGERHIAIGRRVFIGSDSWLQARQLDGDVRITIGDDTKIVGHCVISAVRSVTLGRKVLVARNAYIADHGHAFDDASRAVLEQGVQGVAPVEIGDGAWLGENVVIGPGVSVGRGAVVGANAVVLDDVPDYTVAVGVPARVVRNLAPSDRA